MDGKNPENENWISTCRIKRDSARILFDANIARLLFLLLHFVWSAWALSNHVYLLNLLLHFIQIENGSNQKEVKNCEHRIDKVIHFIEIFRKEKCDLPVSCFLLNQIEMFCQKIRENPFKYSSYNSMRKSKVFLSFFACDWIWFGVNARTTAKLLLQYFL